MSINRALVASSAFCLVAGIALGSTFARNSAGADEQSGQRNTELVEAEIRTLEVSETTTGELATAATTELTTVGSGTITLAAVTGAELDAGSTIARVDENPVSLFIGDQPVWRTLDIGVSDGADVLALEFGLAAMGFDPSGMAIDSTFDSDTAAAVLVWEEFAGLSAPDGVVSMGEIVFAPSPVQVSESVPAGTRVSAGDSLATVRPNAGQGLELTFTVTEEADRYQPGQPVSITAADGSAHDAVISSLERVASSGDGQAAPETAASFTVTAIPQNPEDGLTAGPVTVDIPTEVAADVVAVPARALVAVLEGGEAVRLADGTLVGVEIGVFADGWVEVTGAGIDVGTQVEVAV